MSCMKFEMNIKEYGDLIFNQRIDEIRCKTCDDWHGYVNAKIGFGLCTHFMHETPVGGFCYAHKDKEV